jgi:hypothetical protein
MIHPIDEQGNRIQNKDKNTEDSDDFLGLISSAHGRLVPPVYLLSVERRRIFRILSAKFKQKTQRNIGDEEKIKKN